MDPQNIYSFASVTQFVVYTGKGSLLRNCLSGCQATRDIPKDGCEGNHEKGDRSFNSEILIQPEAALNE